MAKLRMLLIEEDEISREVLQLMLEDKYELTVMQDTRQAESILFNREFDIIVMDFSSNHYDAFSLCSAVASDSLSQPPVVLGIGNDNSDTGIRKAFKSGVYDYFLKPYNVVLFNESLARLSDSLKAYKFLQESDESAKDAFKSALQQASFYGFGLELVSNVNCVNGIGDVAETILKGFSSKGVICAIQFRNNDGTQTYEVDNCVVGERTLQVFKYLHDQGRIYRFGSRIMFNDTHVSLLIKRIESNDAGLFDCLLDVGAKLVPALEARYIAIQENALLLQTQQDMQNIVSNLDLSINEQLRQNKLLIESVSGEIQTSFDRLELTEDQEKFFVNLIEKELDSLSQTSGINELEMLIKAAFEKIQEVESYQQNTASLEAEFNEIELF